MDPCRETLRFARVGYTSDVRMFWWHWVDPTSCVGKLIPLTMKG